MKTKRLFLLAIIALCSIHASMGLDLQKRVKGNEQFASEERLAEPFNSLSASGSIDIQIEYSPIQAPLRIEAESNIIPLINTTVKKGVLNIEFEKNVPYRLMLQCELSSACRKYNQSHWAVVAI
ncbi:GIN domain-containing protein [Porphyromonas gingivalis]|uniref:GIN domain-containing protein n=1 Tax=Porphyromonas gingivalis TaxID=837 RepID=UPI000A939FD3|nr:DUF2807 domain-containing protein [Porphyromonas gingivalis]